MAVKSLSRVFRTGLGVDIELPGPERFSRDARKVGAGLCLRALL
jgi:hypothetical protein